MIVCVLVYLYFTHVHSPVVRHADGKKLHRSEMSTFGFVSEVVYRSKIMLNVSSVERELQRMHHDNRQYPQRLWRIPGMGSNGTNAEVGEYLLFITYSHTAAKMFKSHKCIIG